MKTKLSYFIVLAIFFALTFTTYVSALDTGQSATLQNAIPSSFNPMQATLTPTLFFDGSSNPQFANIQFNESLVDSQGRLILHGSCRGFATCSNLYSISTNGTLNWKSSDVGGGVFAKKRLIFGPDDRAYVLAGGATIFSFNSLGNPVPGFPVYLPYSFGTSDNPVVVDQIDGTVYARTGVTFSYTGFPVVIDAINPNGTLKWRKEYLDGNEGGRGIVQGINGNIYTFIGGVGLTIIDKNNGTEVCTAPNITGYSNSFVGGPDGVFSSLWSVVSSYGANCTSGSIFRQEERDVELRHYQNGIVYAIDYPLYPYDSNQIRLLALSKEGNFLWRASDILPIGTPFRAIKNNMLYMIGNHVTDSNKQKLFLLNASTGEMLNSLETSPYCQSCGVAVANDGTIYLNDLSSTKIYKIAASQPPNQPPTAGFTMTSGAKSATEGQTLNVTAPTSPVFINFSAARSSDADGTVTGWEWKINDNVVSTASSFTYGLNHGSHTVSLTVTDNQGDRSSEAIGQINIQGSTNIICPVLEFTGNDLYAKLIPDDNRRLDNRIPLILIHGNHGNQDNGNDSVLQPNRNYFLKFLDNFFLKDPQLDGKYKIYRFHYESDRLPVSRIGRALRNHIEQTMCDEPGFDKKFVIVAHSMGGLVARSYMNEYNHNSGAFSGRKAGERVLKLITLGTPHHGTPGANDESAQELIPLGWKPFRSVASFFYWKLDSDLFKYTLPSNAPNRSDLLWDNYDNLFNPLNQDINTWLADLNLKEQYAQKTTAYYGYIKPDDPQRRRLIKKNFVTNSSPGTLPAQLISAKLRDDKHEQLSIINIVVDYALNHNFSYNDGFVPIESGMFKLAPVEKRAYCEGYDHLHMLDGANGKCNTNKNLFDSVKQDLQAVP
jgi:triacylglycerol esterase/lipase EstA (alpha/beta hydrolase family)